MNFFVYYLFRCDEDWETVLRAYPTGDTGLGRLARFAVPDEELGRTGMRSYAALVRPSAYEVAEPDEATLRAWVDAEDDGWRDNVLGLELRDVEIIGWDRARHDSPVRVRALVLKIEPR